MTQFCRIVVVAAIALKVGGVRANDKPDLTSPEAAALTFVRAMDAGDSARARSAATGSEPYLKLMNAMAEATRTHKILVSIAKEQFGEQGSSVGGSYAEPGLEKLLHQAILTVEGNSAILRSDPETIFLRLKRIDGEWRVDIDGSCERSTLGQVRALKDSSEAADFVAVQLREGRFRSVKEVRQALLAYGDITIKRESQKPTTQPQRGTASVRER